MGGNPKAPEAVSVSEVKPELSKDLKEALGKLSLASDLTAMAEGSEAKNAYDLIFTTLNSMADGVNYTEENYTKLYNAMISANKKAFGVADGGVSTLEGGTVASTDSTSTMTPEELMNQPVSSGKKYYTETETQVGSGEIEKHWYGNEISRIDVEKEIKNLPNGMTCTYKLNTNVYKNEIKTDNRFFENGAEIGEYEFKNEKGKVIKRDTITIKEWMGTEYVELDGTDVDWYDIDDYEREIKKGSDGKPDLEGTLEKLIRYYADEEPDDFTYDDQVEDSKVTKITNEDRLEMLAGDKEEDSDI